MFSVRITSKWRGAATSFIAAESTSWCSSSTLGNSSLCTRVTTSRHSRLVSSTFILSTLVTRERAASKRGAGDPLDLCHRVLAEVGGALGGALLGAEVDPARELADDEQVGALDDLAAQRAGVEQRGERPDGAQVGVEAEALAQAEQPLLGARRARVGRVPLRPADGGEQDGVGALAGGERLVGQRRAVGVDRGAAERVLLEGEVVGDGGEHLERRGEDLRADPVAGEGDDRGHGPGSLVEYAAPGGVSPTMTLPTVTEILRRPEATTRDTFIADLSAGRRGPRPTP